MIEKTRVAILVVMISFIGSALVLTAHAAEARFPEPRLSFKVDGVAANDRLNIRSQPGADSPIIGSMPAEATGITVTGSWQIIGQSTWWELIFPSDSGSTGWVNSRFLAWQNPGLAAWASAESNFPLQCFGTEPFWSLRVADGRARFSVSGEEEEEWAASGWINARGYAQGAQFYVRLGDGDSESLVAVVRTFEDGYCSDLMSDDLHPYFGTMMRSTGEVLGGCCKRAGK